MFFPRAYLNFEKAITAVLTKAKVIEMYLVRRSENQLSLPIIVKLLAQEGTYVVVFNLCLDSGFLRFVIKRMTCDVICISLFFYFALEEEFARISD